MPASARDRRATPGSWQVLPEGSAEWVRAHLRRNHCTACHNPAAHPNAMPTPCPALISVHNATAAPRDRITVATTDPLA